MTIPKNLSASHSSTPFRDSVLPPYQEAVRCVHLRKPELARAKHLLDCLLLEQPQHEPALLLRATVHEKLRCYGAALDDLRAARKLNPGHFVALTRLAELLCAQGEFQEALSCLDSAKELAKGSGGQAKLRVISGRIHYAFGRRADAVSSWHLALELLPGGEEATALLRAVGVSVRKPPKPSLWMAAHLSLGLADAARMRWDFALGHFEALTRRTGGVHAQAEVLTDLRMALHELRPIVPFGLRNRFEGISRAAARPSN